MTKTIDIDWSSKTILIVEDIDANYLLLKYFLRKTKAMVKRVSDGADAINYVKEKSNVDIILMDIKLPKVNGIAATSEIKKIKNSIPVIAQSAYYQSNERQMIINLGLDDLISKPIEQNNLIKLINQYI
jgi:CheY-like chemotaxis protein